MEDVDIVKEFPDKYSAKIQKVKKILFLATTHRDNYYHWLTWTIPRIYMIEKMGHKLEDFDKIVLNDSGLKFQTELIGLLGIPSEKIVGCRDYDTIFEADIIVSSTLPNFMRTQSFVTKSVRQRFLKPEHFSAQAPKRVYVSRNKSNSRRILNEEDVMNFLSPLGFERFYLEDMTVSEQISLFANAEILISAHGANLTNLVFCSEGTKVIEIYNEKFRNTVDTGYFRICSNMKLEHYFMFGEPINNAQVDMKIDIDKLEKTLQLSNIEKYRD